LKSFNSADEAKANIDRENPVGSTPMFDQNIP
jgi:hypothetical protein